MTANELHRRIKEDIFAGVYTGQLPSIAGFIRKYSVSHNTVKKVLDRLKMENLIYGQKGKGSFIKTEGISDPSRTLVVYTALSSFQNCFYTALLTELKQLLESTGFALKVRTVLTSPEHKFLACAFIGNILEVENIPAFFKENPPDYAFWINRYLPDFLTVCNDNILGAELALNALYRLGHRHIGVLSCDVTGFDAGNFFYHRKKGVEKFCQEHPDLTVAEIETVSNCRKADDFIAKFRAADPEITGIFCFTDMLSLLIAPASGNISVVGYDNRDFAALMTPALTTVAEDHTAMAEALFDMVQRMSRGKRVESVVIPPYLVERESIFPAG